MKLLPVDDAKRKLRHKLLHRIWADEWLDAMVNGWRFSPTNGSEVISQRLMADLPGWVWHNRIPDRKGDDS